MIVLIVLIATIFEILIIFKNIIKKEFNKSKIHSVTQINENKNNITDANKSKGSMLSQILLCFSAYSNSIKILQITKNNEQFGCLHGIRTLSCVL